MYLDNLCHLGGKENSIVPSMEPCRVSSNLKHGWMVVGWRLDGGWMEVEATVHLCGLFLCVKIQTRKDCIDENSWNG